MVALTAVLATGLVACGDEGDVGDGGPAVTAPATTATSAPATQTSVRCANVGFTPNSDDVASDIVATGPSCAEAEALVRAVGGPLGPNGQPRATSGGFTCVRTGRSTDVLESAIYECTSGPRKVTFRRT